MTAASVILRKEATEGEKHEAALHLCMRWDGMGAGERENPPPPPPPPRFPTFAAAHKLRLREREFTVRRQHSRGGNVDKGSPVQVCDEGGITEGAGEGTLRGFYSHSPLSPLVRKVRTGSNSNRSEEGAPPLHAASALRNILRQASKPGRKRRNRHRQPRHPHITLLALGPSVPPLRYPGERKRE